MPEVDEVRRALGSWAAPRGILTDAALRDALGQPGDERLVPFTDAHADYFRTRPIMRIRAEETSTGHRITVSTRQSIAKRKSDELQRIFDDRFRSDGISLVIATAPSYKIDQTLTTFGPPVRTRGGRVTCGSSIGIGNQRNAGTLTALARTVGSTGVLGLSCNHVLGGCSTTVPGTPVVVPGIQDITAESTSLDVVGTFYAAATMSQGLPTVSDVSGNADLACFELDDRGRKLLTSWQGDGASSYDTPTVFAANVARKLRVQKWGRSTAHTEGQVTAVLTDPEPVEYAVVSYFGPQASQTFKGTIYFPTVYEVAGSGNRQFSAAGDSGSLVVTVPAAGADPEVVGVVIAGGTAKTLVLPLKPMLDQLDLELVSSYPAPRLPSNRRRGASA